MRKRIWDSEDEDFIRDLIYEEQFISQVDNASFPFLNDEHGNRPWWDEEQEIISHHKKNIWDVNWDENHEALFTKILNQCVAKHLII